jgi:ABC-type multidrug transport system fused ATPase/permease subunit
VFKDGRIAGFGNHAELLGNNEAYDELFKEQYTDMDRERANGV